MSQFGRSGRFGLVGVVVVAGAVAAVAVTMGQGQAKPKDALALIFGIIGVYVLLLFVFQTRDLSKAEAADVRAVATRPAEIQNPAILDEAQLWAAMAVHPVDDDAVRAREAIWATTRSSIHTGMLVCALIFLTVPPIYLLDTFVPLFVGAPLIAAIALWKSVGLLSGGVDRAYENASRAIAPLGLAVVEHPTVAIQPKYVAPLRMGPALHGALALEGERHGCAVTVRMPADTAVRSPSEVRVGVRVPPFAFRARDGRLKAEEGAPPGVVAALKAVPASVRWNGVRGGGEEWGIVVARKASKANDWLLDLWLAERLADAVVGAAA